MRLGLKALAEIVTVAANATKAKALFTFVMVIDLLTFLTLWSKSKRRQTSLLASQPKVVLLARDSYRLALAADPTAHIHPKKKTANTYVVCLSRTYLASSVSSARIFSFQISGKNY